MYINLLVLTTKLSNDQPFSYRFAHLLISSFTNLGN